MGYVWDQTVQEDVGSVDGSVQHLEGGESRQGKASDGCRMRGLSQATVTRGEGERKRGSDGREAALQRTGGGTPRHPNSNGRSRPNSNCGCTGVVTVASCPPTGFPGVCRTTPCLFPFPSTIFGAEAPHTCLAPPAAALVQVFLRVQSRCPAGLDKASWWQMATDRVRIVQSTWRMHRSRTRRAQHSGQVCP